MKPIFADLRLDGRQFGHLVTQGFGVFTGQRVPATAT
jgi:hypothetical protein